MIERLSIISTGVTDNYILTEIDFMYSEIDVGDDLEITTMLLDLSDLVNIKAEDKYYLLELVIYVHYLQDEVNIDLMFKDYIATNNLKPEFMQYANMFNTVYNFFVKQLEVYENKTSLRGMLFLGWNKIDTIFNSRFDAVFITSYMTIEGH